MRTRNNHLFLSFLMVLITGSVFSQGYNKSSVIGMPGSSKTSTNIVADQNGNTYVGGIQYQKILIVKQNSSNVNLWSKTLSFPV